MSIQIPDCQDLTIEGIRKVLVNLAQGLSKIDSQQCLLESEYQSQIKVRPTLPEILSSLTTSKDFSNQHYVSVESINTVLKHFSETVEKNLQNLAKVSEKQQEILNNLVIKVNTCVGLCHEKSKNSYNYSKKNLKYVHTHLTQLFITNKKSKIFYNWKKNTENSRKACKKILSLWKNSISSKKSKSILRWHSFSNRISIKSLSVLTNSHSLLLEAHETLLKSLKFEYSLFRTKSLNEVKANASELKELGDLALKSDLRIMFQDIRSIVKVHTENLKSKLEEETKSLTQDVRILKDSVSNKADGRIIKDCLDISQKIKSEILDLNKLCNSLQARVSSFDSILHKENTDFKINLLERKIQAVESRISKSNEEKSANSLVITTLYNMPSPSRRPSTSKKRNLLHSRAMSYQNT